MLLSAIMRAYKFLNEKYGIKSLEERRLRRTRIEELNDPFELRPYDLTDPTLRWAFLDTRKRLAQEFGLLCFSADWCDPVIWAHYSDKHRGICLGFEIPPEAERAQTKRIDYISAPLPFPKDFRRLDDQQRLPMMEKVIFTKYDNWKYEHEIRTCTDLEEEFFDFCDVLQLVEVIIGARSTVSAKDIASVLGATPNLISVKKARPAHDNFGMVEDEAFLK
jgi:hypothetical protein